jgi:hypothetical protein
MKKILYIFTALILLASCQKDNAVQSHDKAVATFEVQTPFEFEIKSTTGSGTGSKINALWYGVYHKKADGRFVYMSDMSDFVQVTDIKDISVPITLFKDQEYKIAFIAQHRSDKGVYTYILKDGQTVLSEDQFAEMVLNPKAEIANGEQLDAFVYWEKTGVIKHDNKKEITLSRPLAQINITTTATTKPASIDVTVKSGTTQIANFAGLACSGEHLATVYIFPPASGKVTLDLTKYDADGQQIGTKNIPDVSVAKNFKTNIQGEI